MYAYSELQGENSCFFVNISCLHSYYEINIILGSGLIYTFEIGSELITLRRSFNVWSKKLVGALDIGMHAYISRKYNKFVKHSIYEIGLIRNTFVVIYNAFEDN